MKPGFKIFVYTFFTILLVTFIISLYNKVPNEDEAIIAAHAHHLNELGYVKSDLYSGYGYGWEDRMYFFHKLFVYAGAVAERIAGFNIMTFKFVSLLFYIGFLFLFYKYVRFKTLNGKATVPYLLATSLLTIHFLIFDYAFMYRPEIMMVFFGFTSFYLLEIRKAKKENTLILISGLAAGLSASTHLNGLIFCAAGGLSLLFYKEWKNALLFGFAGFAGIAVYFIDILSVDELKLWHEQFFNDPNVLEKPSAFISLLNEHMRFFWDYRDASFSLLFFFLLIVNFKNLYRKYGFLLIYFLLLVISLGLLAHGKTTKYGVAYLPFMAIICAEGLIFLSEKKTWLKIPAFLLLVAYISIHYNNNLQIISQHINISKRNQTIAEHIPERNVKICAPAVFVFNQIDHFTIRGPIAFAHYYLTFYPTHSKGLKEFLNFCSRHNDKYVVLDKKTALYDFMLEEETLSKLSTGQQLGDYKLYKSGNGIWIFQKI